MQKIPDMNPVKAQPGDKVVFSKPDCGFDHDQALAAQYLEVGKVYELVQVNVGNWYSTVYLVGIERNGNPVGFNSVLFTEEEIWNKLHAAVQQGSA